MYKYLSLSIIPCVLFISSSFAKDHSKPPNVIFVMADDLGIGDVSPTNPKCKIKTPHLQSMADQGITSVSYTHLTLPTN